MCIGVKACVACALLTVAFCALIDVVGARRVKPYCFIFVGLLCVAQHLLLKLLCCTGGRGCLGMSYEDLYATSWTVSLLYNCHSDSHLLPRKNMNAELGLSMEHLLTLTFPADW